MNDSWYLVATVDGGGNPSVTGCISDYDGGCSFFNFTDYVNANGDFLVRSQPDYDIALINLFYYEAVCGSLGIQDIQDGITEMTLTADLSAPACTEFWVGSFGLCRNGVHTWSYADENTCGTMNDLPVDNGTVSACVEPNQGGGGSYIPPKVAVVPQSAISESAGEDTSAFAEFWNNVIDWIIFWK
jgi:hypothetical protein